MSHKLSFRNLLVPLLLYATSSWAAEAAAALEPERIETLDTVLVQGAQPAPGLWTLTKDGKKLLLMATLAPTPKGMSWSSPEVMARIAGVQEVLDPPGVRIATDVGLIRGAMLWPAYRKSQRNPDGQTLRDVMPPELYARWQTARDLYLQGDRAVDNLRPVHASRKLFDAAVVRRGLNNDDIVTPAVHKLASDHSIPIRQTSLQVVVREPKETLKVLSRTSLKDVQCMQETLDRLDGDIEQMAARGNLWAEGDVEALLSTPFVDQKAACLGAFGVSALALAQGIEDLDSQIRQAWLAAVDASLAEHESVFAMVPLDRLEGEKGLLAAMRSAGFMVQGP